MRVGGIADSNIADLFIRSMIFGEAYLVVGTTSDRDLPVAVKK